MVSRLSAHKETLGVAVVHFKRNFNGFLHVIGESLKVADPTSSDPPHTESVHDTSDPHDPTQAPPTPIVASLIVQYEGRRCDYRYSDRGMRTIFIKKPREDRQLTAPEGSG